MMCCMVLAERVRGKTFLLTLGDELHENKVTGSTERRANIVLAVARDGPRTGQSCQLHNIGGAIL